VPLSEREQRLLEQMERALSAEDPRFASKLLGSRSAAAHRRLLMAAVIALIGGVILLVVGVLTQAPLISVAGFVVMFLAVVVAVRAWTQPPPAEPAGTSVPLGATTVTPLRTGKARGKAAGAAKKRKPTSGSFNERMQQRWQRRRENGGF
jgi:uncharacterized membrane protein YphA (DoxX/SURF4 family)